MSDPSDYQRAMDAALADLGEERPEVTAAEEFAADERWLVDAVTERQHECGQTWAEVFRAALTLPIQEFVLRDIVDVSNDDDLRRNKLRFRINWGLGPAGSG